MIGKALALVLVMLLSALAPATAVLGFCAKMPCCFDEAHDGQALETNNAGCCTTINCYEAPSHELTVSAKAKTVHATASVVLPAIAPIPVLEIASATFDDPSPPLTTKQRLASLSILLI